MFREHRVSWAFHRNSRRSPFVLGELGEVEPLPPKEYPLAPFTALPSAQPLRLSLSDALRARASCRSFTPDALSLSQLAALLHCAYGLGADVAAEEFVYRRRPVPSAGALYPLELYVLASEVTDLEPGVYHYAPQVAGIERLPLDLPTPPLLSSLFMGQPYVALAPVIVVFTAVVERTLGKYGDRGYRYLLLEAGHVGQNLALAAAALDLGALSVGGFFDRDLCDLLALDEDLEVPVYAIALGVPARAAPVT